MDTTGATGLRPMDAEELQRVTGGMTPAAAFKIFTTTTKMGDSSVTAQPFYKAQQQARADKAAADFKAANPNWLAQMQGNPFASKGPTVPASLAAQKPNPFPGHPQCRQGK